MKGRQWRGGWKGQRGRGRRLLLQAERGRQAGCQAALRNLSLRYEYSSPSPTVSIFHSLTSTPLARAITSLLQRKLCRRDGVGRSHPSKSGAGGRSVPNPSLLNSESSPPAGAVEIIPALDAAAPVLSTGGRTPRLPSGAGNKQEQPPEQAHPRQSSVAGDRSPQKNGQQKRFEIWRLDAAVVPTDSCAAAKGRAGLPPGLPPPSPGRNWSRAGTEAASF